MVIEVIIIGVKNIGYKYLVYFVGYNVKCVDYCFIFWFYIYYICVRVKNKLLGFYVVVFLLVVGCYGGSSIEEVRLIFIEEGIMFKVGGDG